MYAVLNMGYTPSQWIKLSYKERVFIIASIKLKIDAENKAQNKAKQNARRFKGRRN